MISPARALMTALPQFPNSMFILHFFAEQLIRLCSSARLRAVCMRNSIRGSVRQLLIDKIAKFDVGACFSELESKIRSLIVFKGMQSYSFENIKSLEGYDTDPGRSTARPGGAHQRGARFVAADGLQPHQAGEGRLVPGRPAGG
jgi:hypothetical protein